MKWSRLMLTPLQLLRRGVTLPLLLLLRLPPVYELPPPPPPPPLPSSLDPSEPAPPLSPSVLPLSFAGPPPLPWNTWKWARRAAGDASLMRHCGQMKPSMRSSGMAEAAGEEDGGGGGVSAAAALDFTAPPAAAAAATGAPVGDHSFSWELFLAALRPPPRQSGRSLVRHRFLTLKEPESTPPPKPPVLGVLGAARSLRSSAGTRDGAEGDPAVVSVHGRGRRIRLHMEGRFRGKGKKINENPNRYIAFAGRFTNTRGLLGDPGNKICVQPSGTVQTLGGTKRLTATEARLSLSEPHGVAFCGTPGSTRMASKMLLSRYKTKQVHPRNVRIVKAFLWL